MRKGRDRNGLEHALSPYRGTKWALWDWMAPHMAFPHKGFVDVFGGGGSVTLCKPHVKLNVYNDLDGDVVNFFLQARDNADALAWAITMTPYSAEEFECLVLRTGNETPLELARKWFCSQWMSRARLPFQGGFIRHYAPESKRKHQVSQFGDAKVEMVRAAQLLSDVIIENLDYRDLITRYQHPDTLLYCDPPYLRSTGRNIEYAHDPVGDGEYELHSDLAEILNDAVGYRIVAGSPSDEYTDWYEARGWQRVDTVVKRDGNGGEGRERYYTESMWLCPRVQEALARPQFMKLPFM